MQAAGVARQYRLADAGGVGVRGEWAIGRGHERPLRELVRLDDGGAELAHDHARRLIGDADGIGQ